MAGHHHLLLLLLAASLLRLSLAETAADGPRCLRGLKDSLADQAGFLATWTFPSSPSPGFVCTFTGVVCWNDNENRVLSLNLASRSLSGQLPDSLRFCSSLTRLDLSSNSISGSLPADLCDWLPYLVFLDLSGNSLSGPIPHQLSSCRYLNELVLSSNAFSGSIPPEIGSLPRLTRFSVADNSLSGTVPDALAHFGSEAFRGNHDLCGGPAGSCGGGLGRTGLAVVIAAGVLGALASLAIAFVVYRWSRRRSGRRQALLEGGPGDGSWAARLRQHRLSQVSLFHKPIVKVRLVDLMAATNEFDEAHVLAAPRSGVVYRAVLRDGSALSVKRLKGCTMSEKQFRSEMGHLGQLRHPNLVPLLGYCVVEDERLLVYKLMPGGTLADVLHGDAAPDWPTRARIGIGAARGLAWLHHGIQPALVHQNVCSGTVLLDEDHEARLTDLGVARLIRKSSDGVAKASAFMDGDFGEFGYVAPEYSSTMVPSAKGDVYAFGVVLLELVTGRMPTVVGDVGDGGFKGNLAEWVNYLAVRGQASEAVDRRLLERGHDKEVMGFLKIATGCVAPRPKDRLPMYKVYQELKEIGERYVGNEHYDEFPLVFGKEDAGP